MDTPSRASPGLKMIGTSCSHNTSSISSRKECKEDGTDKPVRDEGDDYIASHQKSMSHIGQEQGQTIMYTPSRAAPGLKIIGTSCSQNTSDTSSRKQCENDGADKPVHDEGDDAIASQQKSMFLVQSHIFQEEGQTTMVDNVSMEDPSQVTHNTTESTAAPTQVTTHTHNSMNTYTKNN